MRHRNDPFPFLGSNPVSGEATCVDNQSSSGEGGHFDTLSRNLPVPRLAQTFLTPQIVRTPHPSVEFSFERSQLIKLFLLRWGTDKLWACGTNLTARTEKLDDLCNRNSCILTITVWDSMVFCMTSAGIEHKIFILRMICASTCYPLALNAYPNSLCHRRTCTLSCDGCVSQCFCTCCLTRWNVNGRKNDVCQ
jgi:hypothetical protein